MRRSARVARTPSRSRARLRREEAAAPVVPVADLNFATATYTVDGVASDLATLTAAEPDNGGYNGVAAGTITAEGFTGDGFVLAGEAGTRALDPAGWVAVLTYGNASEFNPGPNIDLYDSTFATDLNISMNYTDDLFAQIDYAVNSGASPVAGTHILAIRLTPSTLSASFDGAAIATENDPSRTVEPEFFGIYVGANKLARLQLFPASAYADADLPALSALPAPTTPAWLPDGAVAFADFTNENFYADGAETTAEAFSVPDDNYGGRPSLSPAYAGLVSNGATIVATVVLSGGYAISIDLIDTDSFDPDAQMLLTAEGGFVLTNTNSGSEKIIDGTPLSDGTHRAAFTVTGSKLSVSIDGAAFETASASITTPFPNLVWHDSGTASITSLAIYPPRPDAALPALSALT